MTEERSQSHSGHTVLLLCAGTLDIVASFLSFIVFARASPAFFPVAALVTVGLLAAGILISQVVLYVFVLWSLVGAASQLPLRPLPARLSVFAADLLAATLTLAYLRTRRRSTRNPV